MWFYYLYKIKTRFVKHFSLVQLVVSVMKQDESKEYQPPVIRWIPLVLENALCGSPLPGGNEDIDYEDWN